MQPESMDGERSRPAYFPADNGFCTPEDHLESVAGHPPAKTGRICLRCSTMGLPTADGLGANPTSLTTASRRQGDQLISRAHRLNHGSDQRRGGHREPKFPSGQKRGCPGSMGRPVSGSGAGLVPAGHGTLQVRRVPRPQGSPAPWWAGAPVSQTRCSRFAALERAA
jgi:hypothetical protein